MMFDLLLQLAIILFQWQKYVPQVKSRECFLCLNSLDIVIQLSLAQTDSCFLSISSSSVKRRTLNGCFGGNSYTVHVEVP